MPNEHLVMPAHPDDWHLYHAASKTALDEGETAERWSSEGRGGFDSYANFAQHGNSSSSSAASEFDGWRQQALATGTETYRLADVERTNFGRIAEAERLKNRLPVVKDVDLSGLCNDIAVRPQSLDPDYLESRRGVARPPLEVMLDTLLQHNVSPDAAGFQPVLNDARLRVTRGAGDLASVFESFMKATHLAVAAKFNESVPSPTWASDTQIGHFRDAGEKLTAALRAWDSTIHTWDSPPKDELLGKAKACSDALTAMAMECAPGSTLTSNVAFSAVTGLALLMALGERVSTQIQSRFGEVTIQGLYNRILEIPNRVPPDNMPGVAQRGKERFRELANFWNDEFRTAGGPLRSINISKPYYDSIFGSNIQNPIRQTLQTFDATMNNASNFDSPAGLNSMKSCVEKLTRDLYSLRRYVDQQPSPIAPDARGYAEYRAARENILETIDTVAREMQSRLGSAVQVGQ